MSSLSNSRSVALALVLALLGTPPLGAGVGLPAGTIEISTQPAGAAVFLDGQAKGLTPLSLSGVAVGDHRVRVVKDGFVENSRVVSVPAGGRERVDLNLTQAAAPAPAPESQETGAGWTNKKKAIVGGGAAAAILGVILIAGGGSSADENAAPSPGSIGVSPAGLGLAAVTNYTFTAQGAADPENAPLTYAWSFGDGASGSGATVAHVFATGGTFTVTLNVSDGSKSASTTTSLRVGDVNGTWVNIKQEPGTGGVERRIRFEQSGTTLTGTYRISLAAGNTGKVKGTLSPPRNLVFEALLKDETGKSVGFKLFQGSFNADLTSFTGFAQGYLLRNDTLLFGRETE